MPPAPLTGMVGVKLSDVPLTIRRRYGGLLKTALMKDGDGGDVYALMLDASRLETAVEEPSDRTYFVSRAAFEKVSAKWPRL